MRTTITFCALTLLLLGCSEKSIEDDGVHLPPITDTGDETDTAEPDE
jgi:hypothetical protein